ncbi:DUF3995 domain-containing protein [Shimia aestuarii]|uniref:DUF3995 domain-containing protein n=1 Tax=Shimia aestuarii TaxID=254406 RepID=A0A1I4MUE3_9RHOB|nr:DUF3995 domain-containing protein [Shimia aestuarii]SFM06914.1 Protein of unknown function [Shimia aestuarii]
MVVVILAVGVLGGIAGLHGLWAMGIWFPGGDEARLARRVAGFEGMRRMPPKPASLFVALVLAGVAHVLLVRAGLAAALLPGWIYGLAIWGAAAVFLGRGVAAYLPGWRRLTPEEPFATLDRRVYGPLCLALGAVCLGQAV